MFGGDAAADAANKGVVALHLLLADDPAHVDVMIAECLDDGLNADIDDIVTSNKIEANCFIVFSIVSSFAK